MANFLLLFCFSINFYAIETNNNVNNATGIVSPPSTPNIQSETITIELGLFYERYLEKKFDNNLTAVEEYIKILMNGAQAVLNYPTMETKINLVVTEYTIVEPEEVKPDYYNKNYTNSFCKWQGRRRNKLNLKYDLGILLTKTHLANKEGVMSFGLSKRGDVCSMYPMLKNCMIVDISYLDRTYEIAHGIVHMIGVNHPTPADNCDGPGLMNEGGGNYHRWSNCTNIAIKTFLANRTASGCLFKNTGKPLDGWQLNHTDFHSYNLMEHCILDFGKKFKPMPVEEDQICKQLICGHDFIQAISSLRPPMEQTICADNPQKICIRGECVLRSG